MNNMDIQQEEIMELFPQGTKIIAVKGTADNFEAVLRCSCKDKEEFLNWLRHYQDLSKITFRVAVTRPRSGKTVIYKAIYRCQHNTYPSSHQRVKTPHNKHTDCPALLRVTIKSSVSNRRVRSKDELRADYPTEITVIHTHNHRIMAAEALKYRDIAEDVKMKLIDMFRSHHPPARALEILKQDLLEEHEDNYYKMAADSSLCPNIQTVYQLYYSVFKEEFGEEKSSMQEYLKEIVERTGRNTKVLYEMLNENDFVLAAIPPLMQRVHDLNLSGETVYIDSSGNMDRYNCKVFLMLCDSSVGGLPLGLLLTSIETEEAITTALRLFKDILPAKSFGGNIISQPKVFMTDDCQAQINALKNVFPHSNIYLCTFHILQSLWRWLLQSSHNVSTNDRQYIFSLFRKTVYSCNEEDFQHARNNLLSNTIVQKYPNFISYISKYFENANMWAHYCRVMNRGNNTNNTVENAMKIMKEKVLNRTRAYNPVQLYKFLETDLCNYYARKIGDIVSGKYNGHQHLRYFPNANKLKDLEVIKSNYDQPSCTVLNKETNAEYIVNLEIGLCTCPIGKNGAPCKHQHAASLQLSKRCDNIIPITMETRSYYHWIAYGSNVPDNWYGSLSTSETLRTCEDNNTCNALDRATTSQATLVVEHEEDSVKPDWSALESRLNCLLNKWKTSNNSAAYHEALQKTVSYLETCKTETAAISALHCTGKQFKARKYSTQIPVQPTSVSRRKSQCGGRKCKQSGRPLKKSYQDHSYCKKKGEKKTKCPHSLVTRIDKNI